MVYKWYRQPGVQNMCQRVSTADRHFFLLKGGTATVAGTFCQALFAKIFNKCLGKCGSKLHFVARHFFYENIQSAWQSAEENYTVLPGQVQRCGSITLNFDKKCPGWTLLNSALEPTQVFHLQTMGEMTKLSTVAVYQLYDTMHMLCHIFGQMSRFTRIVLHFSWNVALYALCRILAEMSRFTRFARHKFSADRHLKLFCTPASRDPNQVSWFPSLWMLKRTAKQTREGIHLPRLLLQLLR